MATQPQSEFVVEVPRIPPQSTEGIVHVEAHPQLRLQRAPEDVLREAAIAAKALRDLVESKPKKVVFNGKTFLQFEDWLTVARFYGITVAARTTNYVERGRVQGYECHAEAILVSTGQVIGAGQAECLDDERNWNMRAVYRDGQRVGEEKVPLFQLRSMAQTRAQAKALRSILSWVVVLAGYAPTPAEEMIDQENSGRAIASRMECTPMHPERIRKLCFAIANAANMAELKKCYLAAGNEAKKANDRGALDAFIAAKDERKAKLSAGGVQ
jgi:hypothetical protein